MADIVLKDTDLTTTPPDQRENTPWENLRRIARGVRERASGLTPAGQFAICTGTFLQLAQEIEQRSPTVGRLVDQFKGESIEVLARAIVRDSLSIAEFRRGRVVVYQQGDHQGPVTIEPTLDFDLRSINWLSTPSLKTENALKTSLFWILAASFGVDPGPISEVQKNIGTLDTLAAGIMSGKFDNENPPRPFEKSSPPHKRELIMTTVIEGVTLAIDQNFTVSLAILPKAVDAFIGEANQHLETRDLETFPQKIAALVNFFTSPPNS